MFAAAGFEHVVMVDMILGGFDPAVFPIQVVPPQIGARDELLQAQIMALLSGVIANLKSAGMNLQAAPKWILTTFLNLDEELKALDDDVIARLFDAVPEAQSDEDPPTRPPTDSEMRHLWSAISNTNQGLMDAVRENIKLLAAGQDSYIANLHLQGQPTPEELRAQIR